MSRGLGKTERAVLTALPDDGTPRTIYQLTLAIYGPGHLERHVTEQWNAGVYNSDRPRLPLADQHDKVSVRRAVARLERAGLVVAVHTDEIPDVKVTTVRAKFLPVTRISDGEPYGSEVVRCGGKLVAKLSGRSQAVDT